MAEKLSLRNTFMEQNDLTFSSFINRSKSYIFMFLHLLSILKYTNAYLTYFSNSLSQNISAYLNQLLWFIYFKDLENSSTKLCHSFSQIVVIYILLTDIILQTASSHYIPIQKFVSSFLFIRLASIPKAVSTCFSRNLDLSLTVYVLDCCWE